MTFTVRIGDSYRSKKNAQFFLEESFHPGRVSKLLYWDILCLSIITSMNLYMSIFLSSASTPGVVHLNVGLYLELTAMLL